jgi:flavodoxin
MKSLVIYDTFFGSTKALAEAIAKELECSAKIVSECSSSDLESLELLVLGSPIRGWRPSENTLNFIAGLKDLKGLKAATFDTRVRLFIHGDATKAMSKSLEKLGAQIIVSPTSFDVKTKEGTLFEGELEKAVEWAKQIKMQFKD